MGNYKAKKKCFKGIKSSEKELMIKITIQAELLKKYIYYHNKGFTKRLVIQ